MGMPLVRGRALNLDETRQGGAVVINQSMAAQFWRGDDALGKRFRSGQGPWQTIVGIVADSKENSLVTQTNAAMYLPYITAPIQAMTIIVHIATDPDFIAAAIREEIRKVDQDLAVAGMRPLGDVVAGSIGQRSFLAMLLSIFAGIALLLAAGGIYGVISYTVNQSIRDIGVRVALGANRRTVVRHVLGDGLRLILPGVAAGMLGAFAATRLLSSYLFGVTPADSLTFAAVAAFLGVVGILACYIPAWRAASIDPMVALREG
jgi:putative ABC transport system permease protein